MYGYSESNFWQYFFLIVGVAIVILIISNYYGKIKKALPMYSEFLEKAGKVAYLASLLVPILYLPYYLFVYAPEINTYTCITINTHEYIRAISIAIFTAGIYTAATKWVTNSETFKENFKKTILSEEFDNLLSEKIDSFSLSDKYFLKRNDLQDIWKRITICKYEQKFPEIKDSLKSKIENVLFHENNLTYYYKNFRCQINFKLLPNDIVRITEISNFTIVANNTDPIFMDFWVSSDDENALSENTDNETYTRYLPDKCTIDGEKLEIISKHGKADDISFAFHRKFVGELKGKKQYEIERSVEMTQRLSEDRVFSFYSGRIVDNMSVKINHCDKLKIVFSPVGENIFKKDNQIMEGQSFLSREIMLSGEKFKCFIYKKKTNG